MNRLISQKILMVTLSFILLNLLKANYALAQTCHKDFLSASIEHSEHLPPMPKQFRTGCIFKGESLKPQKDSLPLYWYKIPDWSAGTWSCDSETIVESNNPKAVLNKPLKLEYTYVNGMQKDKKNNIWMGFVPNLTSTVEGQNSTIYFTETSKKFLYSKSDQYVVKTVARSIEVNKENFITQSHQSEAIDIISKEGENQVKDSVSVTWFDSDGNVLYRDERFKISHRVEPFKPMDKFKDIDLVDSFKNFLTDNGLSDLIPD